MRFCCAGVYRGFGPTLASEYLAKEHEIRIGREALRQWMIGGRTVAGEGQKVEDVHVWRPRRSRLGELVQWDTSEHDWLEGRGEKLYLIAHDRRRDQPVVGAFCAARFDRREHEAAVEVSGEERPAGGVLHGQGEPVSDGAESGARSKGLRRKNAMQMPPTQIGRALRELGITWIAAHSPQAKGRVERNFGTAQDRLVKGCGWRA